MPLSLKSFCKSIFFNLFYTQTFFFFFFLPNSLLKHLLWEETREKAKKKKKKEVEEIPRKEMPIAAAGQPATQEPRVCPRLPSTPEPVPKGADLFEEAGAAESAERTEYGAAEGGIAGFGGFGFSHSGARSFVQPGSTIGSPPQSPIAVSSSSSSSSSSSFLLQLSHTQQITMEPPRTRSRSRSGYYQQYGVGSNSTGVALSSHHHHQNLHEQQQQHGAGCAPLGAHSNQPENQQRAPGSNAPLGIHRLPSVPGVHHIPMTGKKSPHLTSSVRERERSPTFIVGLLFSHNLSTLEEWKSCDYGGSDFRSTLEKVCVCVCVLPYRVGMAVLFVHV